MPKRIYLFIVRSFNDIDHFTPIFDAMFLNGKYRIHLYTSNMLLTAEYNENLVYLKRKYGLTLNFLLENIALSVGAVFLKKILNKIYLNSATAIFSERLRWVVDRIISLMQFYIMRQYQKVSDEWASSLILDLSPDVVVFDMTYPEVFPNKPLIEAAKQKMIPVIALPHGVHVWTNTDHSVSAVSSSSSKFDGFDYGISQGPLATKHLKVEGWSADKIVEIGSMRFSREWLVKYADICAQINLPRSYGYKRIKIALFLSKVKYRANIEQLKSFIVFLAKQEDICLIIKPHTRGMKLDFIKDVISEYDVTISYEASSYEISQWCEMALVYGSSIGLQILADNKLLIYPMQFDNNHSIYQEYEVACVINSEEDMRIILDNYRENPIFTCYTQENVDDLFRHIVYADDIGRNVIQDQIDFIDSLSVHQS